MAHLAYTIGRATQGAGSELPRPGDGRAHQRGALRAPANKPTPEEITTCRDFLKAAIAEPKELCQCLHLIEQPMEGS